jgi:hypothetical protein
MRLCSNDRIAHPRRVKPLRLACVCALALALLALARPASAEYFQYTTTVTILNGYVPPDNPLSPSPTAPAVTLTTPGGVGITLGGISSNAPGDNIDGTGPGSDIVFGSILVTGLTNSSELENIFIPYTWHIVIDDYAAFNSLGVLGTTTFDIAGNITGTVGKAGGGKQVNLSTNVYTPPVIPPQLAAPSLELYTLANFSYVPPGTPVGEFQFPGAFGAHVSTALVPEPGTITLLSLGALALATPAIRRWRRNSRRHAD